MTREQIQFLATERGAMTASAASVRELAQQYLRLQARIEREITDHSDAIRAGMEEARERGRLIGRPRVEIDMETAGKLWADGYAVKAIARKMGVHRSTLRRRMAEVGLC